MFWKYDLDAPFMSDKSLSKNDIKVILVLAAHARDKKECWPSRATISKHTKIDPIHISETLKRLEASGYIKREFRPGKTSYYNIPKPLTEPVMGQDDQLLTEPVNTPLTESVNTPLTEAVNQKLIKKEEIKKNVAWSKFTYDKFEKLEDRPEPDQNFELLWKKYRKVCLANKSNEGGKLKAWFYYLQCMDSDFKDDQINASLGRYISKKEKSSEKLKNLSNVLNDQELLKQLREEIQEEKEQFEKTKIKGIDTRF